MDTVELETLVYDSFEDIGKPEPLTDDNGNGTWDDGEAFIDVNGNGQWDADMGEAGLGGGGAVVVYRLTYPWGVVTPMLQQVLGGTRHPRLEHRAEERALLMRTPPLPPPRRRPRRLGDGVRADPADPGACSAPAPSSTAG